MTDKDCVYCGEHIHADSLEELAYLYGDHLFLKHDLPDNTVSSSVRSLEKSHYMLHKQNEELLKRVQEAQVIIEEASRVISAVRRGMSHADRTLDQTLVAEVISFFNGYDGSPDIYVVHSKIENYLAKQK